MYGGPWLPPFFTLGFCDYVCFGFFSLLFLVLIACLVFHFVNLLLGSF